MCRVKVMQYSLASNILKGYAKYILLHSKRQILFLIAQQMFLVGKRTAVIQ